MTVISSPDMKTSPIAMRPDRAEQLEIGGVTSIAFDLWRLRLILLVLDPALGVDFGLAPFGYDGRIVLG